jgi:hypothetical protein
MERLSLVALLLLLFLPAAKGRKNFDIIMPGNEYFTRVDRFAIDHRQENLGLWDAYLSKDIAQASRLLKFHLYPALRAVCEEIEVAIDINSHLDHKPDPGSD